MSDARQKILYRLGAILQGVCLGFLVFVGLCELISLSADAQIFRYQGF